MGLLLARLNELISLLYSKFMNASFPLILLRRSGLRPHPFSQLGAHHPAINILQKSGESQKTARHPARRIFAPCFPPPFPISSSDTTITASHTSVRAFASSRLGTGRSTPPRRIYELYGLTEAEIRIVEGVS